MAPALAPGPNSLVLIILLVAAFVVAFKVMQMVFQTLVVAILSSGFYLSLVYLFSYPLRPDMVLLYAFLGVTLYLAYSFISTAYALGYRIIQIPYVLLKALFRPFEQLYVYLRKKHRLRDLRGGSERQEEGDRDVKNVVLDKVGDDD